MRRMPAPRAKERLIERAQWQALRSQSRLDLLMAMEANSPCSIAEVATALGRRPAGLYRHVRALVRADLLREAGRRPIGRRWATLYALGPAHGRTHFDAPSGRGLREHGELVLALARPAGRAYLRAIRAQKGEPQSAARLRCSAMFERTWLDRRSQREVKRLLERLYRIVQQGRRSRRGERFQVSVMSAPTVD